MKQKWWHDAADAYAPNAPLREEITQEREKKGEMQDGNQGI